MSEHRRPPHHHTRMQHTPTPPAADAAPAVPTPARALPTGAWLLAGSIAGTLAPQAAWAQEATPMADTAPKIVITGRRLAPEGKDALLATRSRIGKGEQDLRDIPQSVTVLTEKLLDDRHLDTVKEALRTTAGISFLAAEGGEEDVRLRGLSLQATGDVFVDGVRDPAFYERDTFALDRIEVLRGSAGLLFGRGSTGGAVNQVSKQARLWEDGQVDLTVGSHRYRRLVVDHNTPLSDSAALRISAMATNADNNGSGSALDKRGLALNLREGIGQRDEWSVSLYHLDNRNGIAYGMPWIRPTANAAVETTTVLPVDPTTRYGMASDINHGSATHGTVTHTHRLDGARPGDGEGEWRTTLRIGNYTRDQRASTIRFAPASAQGGTAVGLDTLGPGTVLTRGTQLKIQDMDTLHLQSDLRRTQQIAGWTHAWTVGFDAALEDRTVYGARTAAQGGVDLVKPNTTIGTPDDGAWIDESRRVLRTTSAYRSRGWGVYAQDLVTVAPAWKLLLGLRHDRLKGDYDAYGTPTSATDPGALSTYRMAIGAWSRRAAVLFQPDERHSVHLSAATSFNTSGDTYSLGAANAETPPEQSLNVELGGRHASADQRLSLRWAVFRTTKLHERNTDPLLPVVTLSGRRHVAGVELEVAGRVGSAWELLASMTWLPDARVDQAAACPSTGACAQAAAGEREGDRPALTPRYSGSLWATWQADPRWRFGAGLNLRGRQTPTRATWEVPAFATLDLMAEHTLSEAVTAKLNLTNVANRLYADQLYPGHYVPGTGRLLQMTVSWRY